MIQPFVGMTNSKAYHLLKYYEKMRILKNVYEQLLAHSHKGSPMEACGYLASYDGVIVEAYPLTNIDSSREHFSFEPKEQFAAVRQARGKGQRVCAVYHSHPASPARPSEEDIRLAFDPAMLYVIVSLAGGIEEIRAFWIKEQKVEFENLEVINEDQV